MNQETDLVLQVSDAIALINQTLDYAYPSIIIEGEVASFKVNQGKYVFFDLKDETGTLGCFMMVYQLRIPVENGMRVRVIANPKITQWGKFSLTVRDIQPIGEGSLKRAFEILYAKLDKEGLFAVERKRPLPEMPARIGVISSTAAAGYADFIKILNERWGGVDVQVAHTQVQGMGAAAQIVRAISYFNELAEPPEVLVIVRGGGSADDLSVFNDEPLVRAVAASRIPTLTGIGHEVDTSLVDMVADVQASTPSNAAQIVVPDKRALQQTIQREVVDFGAIVQRRLKDIAHTLDNERRRMLEKIHAHHGRHRQRHHDRMAYLRQLDPKQVLARGYSLMRSEQGAVITSARVGDTVTIETKSNIITAGVTHVSEK